MFGESAPQEVEYDFAHGRLRLLLPCEPTDIAFHRCDGSAGIACTYPEAKLMHELSVE